MDNIPIDEAGGENAKTKHFWKHKRPWRHKT